MKLVLAFFILLNLILGIIFLKIKIFANDVDLQFIRKDMKKVEYEIKFAIYLGGFIKIASFSIKNGFLKMLFFKKEIKELVNSGVFTENIKPMIEKIPRSQLVEKIFSTNVKIENLKFDLRFGTDSVIITSILVGILSAILSGIIAEAMQAYFEKFNKENYKWEIFPNYEEKLFLKLKASLMVSYFPILNKIIKSE